MTNSNRKGKVGERELAAKLREYGLTARRGQQHKGGPDSADVEVEEWPDIHIECKYVAALRIYPAMKQASADAGENKAPVVMHRRVSSKDKGAEWLAIMKLDTFVGYNEAHSYLLGRLKYWKARADAAELTLAENGLESRI